MTAINPSAPSEQAWDGTSFQVFDGSGAYDPAATAAALATYVAATPPPASPAPPAPPAPTACWLSKVVWERRLLSNEFARLDAIRVTVAGRPADWATNTAAPWPAYVTAGVVQALLIYADADQINVLDPQMTAMVDGLPALGVIAYGDYAQPTDGSTPLTSAQWSAERIAALLASTGGAG